MIHFVSGYMRSGTSMMMDALRAGGLDPVFNAQRDRSLDGQYSDEQYRGNPGGYYELTMQQYTQIGFPRMYEGKLVKCMFGGITRIVAGKYKVAFMMRNPEEIRQSCLAIFHGRVPRIAGHPFTAENYTSVMQDTIGVLQMRRDVELIVLNYRDVVECPQTAFRSLGWPIDPEKAAETVNPALCRYKVEALQTGVQ